MCAHEEKYCPRCNASFECKVGNILMCQCSRVDLVREERDYISGLFEDCLCADCLLELKNEYHARLREEKLKKISPLFNKKQDK